MLTVINHLVESAGESPSHPCFVMYERYLPYSMLLVASQCESPVCFFSSSALATRLPFNQINSQQIENSQRKFVIHVF